ncbi:branched-chain amino acid transport system II carrier protein [Jeotgalibacillus haloalkalitolerans]|uniref:Branched-chain amino acid transport system carrier protein n=1 Tax=Jeotgalibacillus haloalkalitolerans TaxID=3104292 RepID=A0ABU5KN27_9BACL|nr:branched-chain amino acid transport system II carrier protein [Jeotgalibacillus sp. HH7-29]MDZ5712483.1 branched-chain amino acid transport system II carrier protein [Jeotgalibacillus sp. HH7-29]
MNSNKITLGSVFTIGLMLFALFLGAGNMIFPPLLGQQSGDSSWIAIAGFLLTGVGLPLLGVIAIAKSGGSPLDLASRVHPIFGIIFTIILYLAIGPFFGIPRTATVSYEIGILPFLAQESAGGWTLLLFSILFFAVTAWLSLNPAKLVDRIGKILTPALVIILAVLVGGAFINPMGEPGQATGGYADSPFITGFLEGYLTLDAIAALVFAIVIISAIENKGVTDRRQVVRSAILAGLIAASGLGAVYLSLSYLGATSLNAVGVQDNGGALLSAAANYLYGPSGAIILGIAIGAACLTTSIGLVSATSSYFSRRFPKVSYRLFVLIFSVFSMMVANIGLAQLIAVSVPVLVMIYPMTIVLISLSFLDKTIKGKRAVYVGAIIPTLILGISDGLAAAGFTALASVFSFLPLMDQSLGWILPAIAGGLIGMLIPSATGSAAQAKYTN